MYAYLSERHPNVGNHAEGMYCNTCVPGGIRYILQRTHAFVHKKTGHNTRTSHDDNNNTMANMQIPKTTGAAQPPQEQPFIPPTPLNARLGSCPPKKYHGSHAPTNAVPPPQFYMPQPRQPHIYQQLWTPCNMEGQINPADNSIIAHASTFCPFCCNSNVMGFMVEHIPQPIPQQIVYMQHPRGRQQLKK